MARWSGLIGFVESTRVRPGVSSDVVVEKGPYYGDEEGRSLATTFGDAVNPDLRTTTVIKVIADDEYLSEHISAIRFVEWAGDFWFVTEVTVKGPRLLLRLGGVYAGNRQPTAPAPGTP